MDFIVLFTLINVVITLLTLSYDIMCQWSRNLKTRVYQFPPWMRIPDGLLSTARYVIPSFHIYAHGKKCHYQYSLNFLKWSARTNGEDVERWWAHINPVSMSTKEMGPGARYDTLDDHAAAWNWRKITGFGTHTIHLFSLMDQLTPYIGKALLRQLRRALQMRARHQALHAKATSRFELDVVQKWEEMVKAWEDDITKPCPYEEPTVGVWLNS
jgi:Kyakuja-Dileera-Zisupton transposase